MSSPSFRIPKFLGLLFLFLLIFSAAAGHAEQVKNLKPQGYVSDFAGVLSAQVKDKLVAICTELDQKASAQIAIVTVSSLEGEPIEQFSIDLATAWGIGPKQKDRGVLILLAANDHRYRFEVGYGLEAILPDGKVGGFGREAVPLLRQSDYSGAVLLMTERVAQVIAADRNVTLNSLSGVPPPPQDEEPSGSIFSMGSILWIVIVVVIVLFSPALGILLNLLFGGLMGPPRGRGGYGGGWYGGGSWGGSGGGGGGGGFGGFGGGSFGGGGASGSW